jgi:hypothetical protein
MVEWYIFSSLFSGITDDLANEDIETKQNIFNFIDYKARTNNIYRTGSPHVNSPGFGLEYSNSFMG